MIFNESSPYLKKASPIPTLGDQFKAITLVTDGKTETQRAQVTWNGSSMEAGPPLALDCVRSSARRMNECITSGSPESRLKQKPRFPDSECLLHCRLSHLVPGLQHLSSASSFGSTWGIPGTVLLGLGGVVLPVPHSCTMSPSVPSC